MGGRKGERKKTRREGVHDEREIGNERGEKKKGGRAVDDEVELGKENGRMKR